jgi:hypothetical protein
MEHRNPVLRGTLLRERPARPCRRDDHNAEKLPPFH